MRRFRADSCSSYSSCIPHPSLPQIRVAPSWCLFSALGDISLVWSILAANELALGKSLEGVFICCFRFAWNDFCRRH